jgi:hypothetical protein
MASVTERSSLRKVHAPSRRGDTACRSMGNSESARRPSAVSTSSSLRARSSRPRAESTSASMCAGACLADPRRRTPTARAREVGARRVRCARALCLGTAPRDPSSQIRPSVCDVVESTAAAVSVRVLAAGSPSWTATVARRPARAGRRDLGSPAPTGEQGRLGGGFPWSPHLFRREEGRARDCRPAHQR